MVVHGRRRRFANGGVRGRRKSLKQSAVGIPFEVLQKIIDLLFD